jgi:hypothetical protein
VAIFKLARQPGQAATATRPAAHPAGLPAPRPAAVTHHPAARAANASKAAKASGGVDEWTEF